MPLEYQTYLLATDLRTPEDVLAWFRVQPRYPFEGDLVLALAERLDRERRQACRRGMQEAWVNAIDAREGERVWERNANMPLPRTYSPKECLRFAAEYRAERPGHLQRALAFRAAARQP